MLVIQIDLEFTSWYKVQSALLNAGLKFAYELADQYDGIKWYNVYERTGEDQEYEAVLDRLSGVSYTFE